jgi:pimeloyl-ACP methyl ester carboxylesterase
MGEKQKKIYCISGLGADGGVFDRLAVNGHVLHPLSWIPPGKKESITSYAFRMAEQIIEERPIVLGLSFGGMLAIEMAREINMEKVIIISAPKTRNEIPSWMRWAGRLKMNKWLPVQSNRYTERADDRRMGIETKEEKAIVEAYRKTADLQLVNWGINQILNWKNKWIPPQLYQIHGEKDQMFPLKNIQTTYIIPDGSHIMILNRPGEIGACVERIVRENAIMC